jgi:Predicted pyridoxal phosphate-dependent enzyme apparently involved in regulation of cell wall biogenesis
MKRKKVIPVNTPFFNGNEKKYLNECIETGWISSEGPFVKKFEEECC